MSELRIIVIYMKNKLRPKFRPELRPKFRPKTAIYKAHFCTVEIGINAISERVVLIQYLPF